MSWQQVGVALEHGERQQLPPAERFVLVLLGWFQHAEVGEAWPSVTMLARVTGLSRRTVFRALDRLEAAGIIRRESRRGRGRTSRYRLVAVEKVPPRHLLRPRKGDTVAPLEVTPATRKRCHGGTQIRERSEKGSERRTVSPRTAGPGEAGGEPVPARGPVAAVFAEIAARRPRQVPTDSAR